MTYSTQGVLQNILCNRLLIHIRTAGITDDDQSLEPQSVPYSSGDRIVIHMHTHSVHSHL